MFMCIYTTMDISFFFFYFFCAFIAEKQQWQRRVFDIIDKKHIREEQNQSFSSFSSCFFPARQEATCHAYLSSLSLAFYVCVFFSLSLSPPLASFRLLGLMYRLVVRWCWCVCHEYNCKKLSLSHPNCPRLGRQRTSRQGYEERRESRDDSH